MSAELLQHLPVLFLIMLLGSAVQGATGFGFGLIAVAGASLFVELHVSTPLVAVLNLPVVFYLLSKLWRDAVWRRTWPLLVGMLAGVPFGVFVLVNWPQELLMRCLAVVLLYTGFRTIIANRRRRESECPEAAPSGLLDDALGVGIGAVGGALGGAFNTGGPPVMAYVYCRPWTKEQRTATVQATFAIGLVYRIGVLAYAGLYDRPLLTCAGILLPASLLGMLVGYRVFKRMSQRTLEVVVAVLLLVIGMKLMLRP